MIRADNVIADVDSSKLNIEHKADALLTCIQHMHETFVNEQTCMIAHMPDHVLSHNVSC